MPVGSSVGISRSSSIPLPSSHVTRTQSELQLSQDQEMAEHRDTNMFYRLVNGIRERQTGPDEDMDMACSPDKHIAGIVKAKFSRNQPEIAADDDDSQNWQMLHATLGRVSEASASDGNEWSISGFDSQHESNAVTRSSIFHHEAEDHDEGVFSLEL